MNCSECRDDFAAYQEGLLDPAAENRIKSHLADCPACRAEFDQMQQLVVRLARGGLDAPGISLESPVMDRILQQQALVIRRLKMRKRIRLLGIGGVLTAASVLLVFIGVLMNQPNARVQAAEVLAQGAQAVPKLSSIYIRGKMRTAAHDNFGYINSHLDFVPIELWKQLGEKTKWRVEKPERVAVMDGDSTVMWMKPLNEAVKIPSPHENAFDTHWLLSLTNVKDLINEELQSALSHGWDMKLAHEKDQGVKKLLVTIEKKAQLIEDARWKNSFIDASDTRQIYRFDAETKRLEAFQIYLHENGKDVLVFETDNIDYGKTIDSAVFTLPLPEDVVWLKEQSDLPDNVQAFLKAYTKSRPNISSIYIQGKIRTSPQDNFSAIAPEDDFVPIELWAQFGDKTKWRVEKPERVVVMDGGTTIMLIKHNNAFKIPYPTYGSLDTGWIYDMTDVQQMVARIRNDLTAGADLKIADEEVDGAKKLLATLEVKARLIKGREYLKNKFIDHTDTRRIYRFDAETKRLESVKIYLREKEKDVLLFETNSIHYDKAVDPAMFALKLPEDVEWFKEPARPGKLPNNEKYEKMAPKETAAAFFEACSKEDWDEAEKFCPYLVNKSMRAPLAGLQVISLGEPFQEKPSPDWLVPYEIKLKDGETSKSNLRLSNDNPGKRYVVEGGL
jgi:hypothetical protein